MDVDDGGGGLGGPVGGAVAGDGGGGDVLDGLDGVSLCWLEREREGVTYPVVGDDANAIANRAVVKRHEDGVCRGGSRGRGQGEGGRKLHFGECMDVCMLLC